MSQRAWKFVGAASVIVAIVAIWQLMDVSRDLELLGISASAWLVGLILYVLGVLAGVGAVRGKPQG
jgi:uncharacterized membrane protein (DUF4010 family)